MSCRYSSTLPFCINGKNVKLERHCCFYAEIQQRRDGHRAEVTSVPRPDSHQSREVARPPACRITHRGSVMSSVLGSVQISKWQNRNGAVLIAI